MLEKISLDTIEELSNSFMNKFEEIKDKLLGKDEESENKEAVVVESQTNSIEDETMTEDNEVLSEKDSSYQLRKRKHVQYFTESKKSSLVLKNSWKKKVPVMRNSNDHYALMDFSHNKKPSKYGKRRTI